jgi:heme/copper-type cytochrome/quinol oxidase subunit 2
MPPKAFSPLLPGEFRSQMITAVVFLLGGFLGLLARMDSYTFETIANDYGVMVWLLTCGFPILWLVAIILTLKAARHRRQTIQFDTQRQMVKGEITYLWSDKSEGKKYFAAYLYLDGLQAYQQVHPRTFKRLQIGEAAVVEYLPDKPQVSILNLNIKS